MTDEDRTAAKLKGYNILIKFKDGEELLIKADIGNTPDDISYYFEDIERILNVPKKSTDEFEPLPFGDFAFAHDSIKYIKKI